MDINHQEAAYEPSAVFWLNVFMLVHFFGPIVGFLIMLGGMHSLQRHEYSSGGFIQTAAWGVFIVSALYSICAARKISKVRNYTAVQFAIKAEWISGPACMLGYTILLNPLLGSAGQIACVLALMVSVAVAVLWTRYFRAAKEVQEIYGFYYGEHARLRR